MLYWYARDGATTLLLLLVARAVASLKEAEGHQHLAGGHGGGCEQMSPLPPRGPSGFFLYILNTKSCILMHSLAPKMGITSVLSRPPWIGEMKTAGRGCRMRPKAESRVEFLGRGQQAPPARRPCSDVNKTKDQDQNKTKTAAYKTNTKTTGSKQRHLADLTFK